MRNKIFTFFCFALLFASQVVSTTTFAGDNKVSDFSLKDQFGKVYDYKFPREKVSILAFGDKDGSEQLEPWIRQIYDKYTDKIDIQGVAELSAVPGIARGIVRAMIKKKSKQPVMLDWEGKVSKDLKYQKKLANIYVIDKTGNIIVKEVGISDEAKLKKVFTEIDKLLK
jgi:AhpC/TSA family